MTELFYAPEDREYRHLSDIEILNNLGFSFVTPASSAKKRNKDRMEEFDRYDGRKPEERRAKIIAIAYYALELSTPLPQLDSAIGNLEKLEPEDRKSAQNIIDNFVMATQVDQILSAAYDKTQTYTFSQLEALRRETADYISGNTGALKALADMSRTSGKLGSIAPITSRSTEILLRSAIAEEVGIDIEL